MGRPPCCEKVGIKKGPWTPEEDIVLVSYIQQHGPGNWRSVPTNTGLLRCSKSCRLRWTNYLRPGIKRGNFTPHEEGTIIHLQALLGNKWAAIASYLPQRTDNDIKNYWNTHLKKKIKKLQSALDPQTGSDNLANFQFASKSFSDKSGSGVLIAAQASSTYASSTGNISRLLEGWMRSSSSSSSSKIASEQPSKSQQETSGPSAASDEDLASILPTFDRHHNINGNFACDHQTLRGSQTCGIDDDESKQQQQRSEKESLPPPPLSFLENWLFGENSTVGQVEEGMVVGLPPIFS